MWRWAARWAVLFAIYAATAGVDTLPGADFGPEEARYLQSAESIADDGDVDDAPHGIGFPLLIAPAQAIGGGDAVELLLAAIAALAFVLALALARHVVPEPWATRGVALVAISPPALAHATAVLPGVTGAAILCAAALLAIRVHEHPRRRHGLAAAGLLALLPWLDAAYALPALPLLLALVHWTSRRGRKVLALLEVELVAGSLVAFATVNGVLYGGLTPGAADPGPAPAFPGDYLDRLPRLVGLWLDRDAGLLRWAPVLALAGFGAVLLWRSRRDALAAVLPGRRTAEAAAALAAAVVLAQIVAAALVADAMAGPWFPGRHLVPALPFAAALAAWGLQRAPRAGAALGALTVLASGWLLVALASGRSGGWGRPGTDAPLGPLVDALPEFGAGSAWADAVTAGAIAAAVVLVVRERRGAAA